MRIIHVAHYDVYPRSAETFINNSKNGLEQWLNSAIKWMPEIEHLVLFFNHYENTVFIEKITANGTASVYTHYGPTTYTESELNIIFKDIIEDFSPNLIHIHYLQEYTKRLPKILFDLGFENIIATIHDESFLGENYGMDQNYSYDKNVETFFEYSKKIIFLHEVSKNRFEKMYFEVLKNKTTIIPNGIDLSPLKSIKLNFSDKLRVLFLGSFNQAKGSEIIEGVVSLGINNQIEYFLLGKMEIELPSIKYQGSYTRLDIAEKIAEIQPDIIAIPSIVEETFSYTALEATALGYPVVCFNVGALQMIEKEQRGFIVQEKTADAFHEKLLDILELKSDRNNWEKMRKTIGTVKLVSIQEMVDKYSEVYYQCKNEIDNYFNFEKIFQRNLQYLKYKEQLLFEKEQQYKDANRLRSEEAELAFGLLKKNAGLEKELASVPKVVRKILKKIKPD